MPEINLTEQEVQTLLRCLNDRVEPSEELAVMVNPGAGAYVLGCGGERNLIPI